MAWLDENSLVHPVFVTRYTPPNGAKSIETWLISDVVKILLTKDMFFSTETLRNGVVAVYGNRYQDDEECEEIELCNAGEENRALNAIIIKLSKRTEPIRCEET